MSLERRDEKYTNFRTKLVWMTTRMRRFYEAARSNAMAADEIWDQYTRGVGQLAGLKDKYDKCVARQEMYDRWAMREAAVIQAEIAIQNYWKDHPGVIPQQLNEHIAA